ncbi:MAG: hypothetical protein K2X27_10290 [Candidatus Obscuribacterales bacterium]|nr:hypothetical protein [Candidatus Obscuribacterales bacterium]
MFEKLIMYLLRKDYWVTYYRSRSDDWKKQAKRETERADKNYRDLRSMAGEARKFERKLIKTREYCQKVQDCNKKLKEQLVIDRQFIERQKQQIEDLKAEISHLWQGKETTEIIRCD